MSFRTFKISGGKVLSSRTRRSSNRASALLRLAAVTVGRTETALGAFYRRLAGGLGPRCFGCELARHSPPSNDVEDKKRDDQAEHEHQHTDMCFQPSLIAQSSFSLPHRCFGAMYAHERYERG
jgi:hypothetical protein